MARLGSEATSKTIALITGTKGMNAGLEDALELYADSVMHSLDAARGDWGSGMFYAGGYEVAFGAVKRGGRNFIQAAKISFEIAVSRS